MLRNVIPAQVAFRSTTEYSIVFIDYIVDIKDTSIQIIITVYTYGM